MRHLFLLAVCFHFSLVCFSQTQFQPGYIIDNNQQKIDCLIKNLDWESTPKRVVYKFSENEDNRIATSESIVEFGLKEGPVFQSFLVEIDRWTDETQNLNMSKELIFNEERVFLQLIIDGEASLFYYKDGDVKKYFYRINEEQPQQLVYKKYLNERKQILENNAFRFQLWEKVNCSSFNSENLAKLDYRKNDLVNHFVAYNVCKNATFMRHDQKQKKQVINFNLRPGLMISSLSINDLNSDIRDIEFDNNLVFRLGVEAEFILPFNNDKWAALAEGYIQSYQDEQIGEFANTSTVESVVASYQSLVFAFGLRHFIFLGPKTKLFANASFVFDLPFDSSIERERRLDFDVVTRNNLAFGIGLSLNDSFGFELRHSTDRDILSIYPQWDSYYISNALICFYTIK